MLSILLNARRNSAIDEDDGMCIEWMELLLAQRDRNFLKRNTSSMEII
jgi:hypothetical protein